jgi:hypothetical protein
LESGNLVHLDQNGNQWQASVKKGTSCQLDMWWRVEQLRPNKVFKEKSAACSVMIKLGFEGSIFVVVIFSGVLPHRISGLPHSIRIYIEIFSVDC